MSARGVLLAHRAALSLATESAQGWLEGLHRTGSDTARYNALRWVQCARRNLTAIERALVKDAKRAKSKASQSKIKNQKSKIRGAAR